MGLIGGGHIPIPGEVSLAHNGVLFLDELPEFRRQVLEVLRQPLDDGVVTIARASMSVTFPARLMLVGAMNPCPCGQRGHPEKTCTCTPLDVKKYLSRISGPLLDRIDLHVDVPPVQYRDLASAAAEEGSAAKPIMAIEGSPPCTCCGNMNQTGGARSTRAQASTARTARYWFMDELEGGHGRGGF